MKVLIVSGFLGAGKTTFIKHLTSIVTEYQFAIFENEFGQTDIDAQVLKDNCSLKVWEMSENCVCCSGKSDFITSLFTISSAVNPEILIVEPTGIAKLGVLIDNIENLNYDRIKMLKSIAIVDINSFLYEKEKYDDIYLNQIENAATIILSKSEAFSDQECIPYIEAIRKINSDAEIICGDYSKQPYDWWENLLKNTVSKPSKENEVNKELENNNQVCETEKQEEIKFRFNKNKTTMKTMTIKNVTLPTPVHLMMILDLVVGGVFGDIPRAKGYINCHTKKADGSPEWIRFDLVNQKWQMTGFDPQKQASLTFIGNEINEEDLKEYFTIFNKKKTKNKLNYKKINFLKNNQ